MAAGNDRDAFPPVSCTYEILGILRLFFYTFWIFPLLPVSFVIPDFRLTRADLMFPCSRMSIMHRVYSPCPPTVPTPPTPAIQPPLLSAENSVIHHSLSKTNSSIWDPGYIGLQRLGRVRPAFSRPDPMIVSI